MNEPSDQGDDLWKQVYKTATKFITKEQERIQNLRVKLLMAEIKLNRVKDSTDRLCPLFMRGKSSDNEDVQLCMKDIFQRITKYDELGMDAIYVKSCSFLSYEPIVVDTHTGFFPRPSGTLRTDTDHRISISKLRMDMEERGLLPEQQEEESTVQEPHEAEQEETMHETLDEGFGEQSSTAAGQATTARHTNQDQPQSSSAQEFTLHDTSSPSEAGDKTQDMLGNKRKRA
jgi:hypothetical protein